MLKKCNFCGNSGFGVKAHVIPEAFFRDIVDDGLMLKQRELGKFPKKSPVGPYDSSIWCQQCEKDYGNWDDVAIRLLRTPMAEFINQEGRYELEVEKEDLLSLRLFFISMLWRASNSNQHLYRRISIGPHEEIAKSILTSRSIENTNQFSTTLTYSGFDSKIILEPVPVKHDGINYIRFFLGKFIAEIKVDQRPVSNKIELTVIGKNKNLCILKMKRNMKVAQSISKIAKAQLSKGT
ncbi:hypothetical protein [Janthinobacterium sp. RT4P48]|uniref:hypothetical protein n=1 Tax=Janthinobacterium sp. RT4P48 TaxID=3424188 RepID=UPI003F2094EA